MLIRSVSLSAFFVSILLFGGLGCSGAKSTPTVSGKVTLDGDPLSAAEVSFEGPSLFTAKTDDKGEFKIDSDSPMAPSVKPGEYNVFIHKLVDAQGKVPNEEDYEQMQAAGGLKNMVPPKYNNRERPLLTAKIEEGENKLPPFELKKK